MLLSALALAAVLQTTPVAGEKSYLLQQKPFDTAQRVDQLRMPFPKKAKPMTGEGAPQRFFAPRAPRRVFKAPPATFVHAPMMANCHVAPQVVGHPETLQVQPLSKMPKARGERAVARLVDGCPVPVLIAQADPAR